MDLYDNVDEAVSYGEDTLRYCLESNCTKVLIAERRVSDVLNRLDQHEMVQRLIKPLEPYQLSIAALPNIDHLQDT
ncbi:MAG: hypothetical protein WBN45_13410 [Arenicellales bacterium]